MLVSRFGDRLLSGILSSFFTALLLITLGNRAKPTSHTSTCTCQGDISATSPSTGVQHLPGASSFSCNSNSSKSRFLVDAYPVVGPVPWEHLSKNTQDDFSLNGQIQVGPWFHTPPAGGARPEWPTSLIDRYVYLVDAKNYYVGTRLSPYGPDTNDMFFQALDAYPVKGKSVLVVGSASPWVEAFCISYGASSITSVDFNVPITNDTRIKAIPIAELDATDEQYDALFSYSSLEHDGLGRYGDPLNPWGDIERMKKLQKLIRPGGKFYLGVTNGNDSIHFNAHRIYGRIRFPMLIQGWKLERTFGPYTLEQHYGMVAFAYLQPLHVLSLKNAPG